MGRVIFSFSWIKRITPARWALLACTLLAATIVIILLCAKKPWELQVASPGKIKLIHQVRYYEWWAAAINLLPLAVLAATSRWWMRPLPALPTASTPASPRWFRPVVLAAVVACAAFNAPRLTQSFWDDEEYSVRRAVLGAYKKQPDGTLRFRELPWMSTLWAYEKPTNHILQSAAARLSNDVWRKIARPHGLQFWEPAVRFPSYLAGLGALAVLAALLARLGYPAAGAVAAWLLAVHPWYARFASEARGYAFVFLFLGLAWLFFVRAAASGRWGWWIGFGLAQFALVWTWPASATIAAVNGLLAGAWLAFSPGQRPVRGIQLGRWVVVSAAGAMAAFQLLLPCVPQFAKYLDAILRLPLGAYWARNVACLFVTGSHWTKSSQIETVYPEFLPIAHAMPWASAALFALFALFVVLGTGRLLAARNVSTLFILLWTLPAAVVYAGAHFGGQYLYEWYLSFALPGVAALAALGATLVLRLPGRSTASRLAGVGVLVALLAGYFAITQPQRHFLMSRSVQCIRESVLATRPGLDPFDPAQANIVTVSTILSPLIYDPMVKVAPSPETLAEVLGEADAKGATVFLNQGFPALLKSDFPATHAFITDPEIFELVCELPGIEQMLDRAVYRYRSGSIAGKDLSIYGTNPPLDRKLIY